MSGDVLISGKDSSTGIERPVFADTYGLRISSVIREFLRLIAGETNIDSATNAYLKMFSPYNITCCDGTGAVSIGAGSANDTMLAGIYIEKNAGPGVVTVAGFGKATSSTGTYTAKNITIQGSTTLDVWWLPPGGLINNVGAMTVTCTVDEIAWAIWRPIG